MSDARVATARDEIPVYFPVGADQTFGILTRPTTEENGICVIHLAGKGPSIATVGRGRMSPLLARRLASLGFHSFRTEYSGTGDSFGPEWQWSITPPPTEDVRAALRWLRGQGMTHFVLAGTCGGSRVALEAGRHEDGVVGVVLLLPPIRDTEPWRRYDTLPTRHLLARLLKRRHLAALRDKGRRRMYLERARTDILRNLPGKVRRGSPNSNGRGNGDGTTREGAEDPMYQWIGPGALHGLEDLVAKDIPTLIFFGDEDNDFRDWEQATKGPAGPVLERAGDLIQVETVGGRYYNTPSTVMSQRIAPAIAAMVDRTGSGARP